MTQVFYIVFFTVLLCCTVGTGFLIWTRRRHILPKRPLFKQAFSVRRTSFGFQLNPIWIRSQSQLEELLSEMEPVLIAADLGVRTTTKLLDAMRKELQRQHGINGAALKQSLKHQILDVFNSIKLTAPKETPHPQVILFVGVNGVGKTTTIGKMAAQLKKEGKKVLLAAGDTFRAAAVEQLEIWGSRNGIHIVKGGPKADPAAVLFNAIQEAIAQAYDVVLCDTAGRLHTKIGLMDELAKIRRVVHKALPGAPHEIFLVIDGTTGQNALVQARQFNESVPLTGIVLTKLDGTAKGGMIVAIADELRLPIRYIGVGEGVDDLKLFESQFFVESLFESGEQHA